MTQGGSTYSTSTYNAYGQVVETVYPVYNNIKVEGVFDPAGRELGYFDGVANAWYDRDLWVAGRMFAQSYANETYFLHANELHSDAQVTDHSGAGTLDLLYYPWGQIWTHTGYLSDAHFAGFQQGASDLYATPTRHYSNDVGRWLSPDPLGGDVMNPQSLNRYAYVLNNPTTLTDPLGLVEPPGCDPGAQCVLVVGTPPPPIYISGGNGGLNGYLGYGPTPPGLQVSTTKLIVGVNQCAAQKAESLSVASLLGVQNNKLLNTLFGSSTASLSRLVFGTSPNQYLPAGAGLAASTKAGVALTVTVQTAGRFEVDQGFQSIFTTVAPTSFGQTAVGQFVTHNSELIATGLDVLGKGLFIYDAAAYVGSLIACTQ